MQTCPVEYELFLDGRTDVQKGTTKLTVALHNLRTQLNLKNKAFNTNIYLELRRLPHFKYLQ